MFMIHEAALVTVRPSDPFVSVRAYTKKHGRSCEFLINKDKLSAWLNEPDTERTRLFDTFCGNYLVLSHDNDDTVRMTMTVIEHRYTNDTFAGYELALDLPVSTFENALSGSRVRQLASLERSRASHIHLTEQAQRKISILCTDKRVRRALSKALRDNFRWDTPVYLYADFGRDFYFVEDVPNGINGGLCFSDYDYHKRSGESYPRISFSVHT